MPDFKMRCGNCMYYLRGYCYFHPPRAFQNGHHSTHPEVDPDCYCHNFTDDKRE